MTAKEKIVLTWEQETLLIPLYAKTQDNPVFVDEKARQILASVDYDFQRLKVHQKPTRIRLDFLDWRSKKKRLQFKFEVCII